MPFIKLSNPAVCTSCHGYLKKGRVAFWELGTMTCVRCCKKQGIALYDEDEETIMRELEERIK